MIRALHDRRAAHQEVLPDLVYQLRSAVQQTEQAVFEISDKFMNIAGRARRQLQETTELVGSLEQ